MTETLQALDVDATVRARYSQGAREQVAALCCPVDYDPRYLEAIPREVLERDYGCGDPSRYVREGETVLDLGSGGGKIAFIAAQLVGARGRVIGVDVNDDMLGLARRSAPEVAGRIGYANVEFRRGRIQDLRLDLDRVDEWLRARPVTDALGLAALEEEMRRLRAEAPLVASESVDTVVSNCVLNLVREEDKGELLREIFRVLRPGGRIAISDIVSDEVVPEDLKADPELWSGCVSGAFQERSLLEGLEAAGFYGIAVDKWEDTPFRTVRGIEFRSVTVTAHRGKEGPCFEGNEAVVYRGPWKEVRDDDGHVFRRGERAAVCAKTFGIMTHAPYAEAMIPIPSRIEVEKGRGFDCRRTAPRHPRETKGEAYEVTTEAGPACAPGSGCC